MNQSNELSGIKGYFARSKLLHPFCAFWDIQKFPKSQWPAYISNTLAYNLPKIAFVTGALSVAAGAINGYSDANDVLLSENKEFLLKYGASILHGIPAGFLGATFGYSGLNMNFFDHSTKGEKIKNAFLFGTLGTIAGATLGGLETLVGYGFGQLIGRF